MKAITFPLSSDNVAAVVAERDAKITRLRAALDRAADALEFYDNKAEAEKARAALKD